MKYLTKKLLIILSIFYSCNGSYQENLSGGYIYHDAGKEYQDIILKKDVTSINSLSDNYKYIRKNIYSNVVDYSYNARFIIAEQWPNKKWHREAIIFELQDTHGRMESIEIADSILENDVFYRRILSNDLNYWIIDVDSAHVYGPLSKSMFQYYRDSLNIPDQLSF